MKITFETVSTEAAFAGLAGEWDVLVRAMARPSPLLLHAWLLEWWRHRDERAQPAVSVARREGRLVAALPLQLVRRSGLQVAEFPGGERFALGDVLLARDESGATAAALAEYASAGHDLADLFGLAGESTLCAVLKPGQTADGRANRGARARSQPRLGSSLSR